MALLPKVKLKALVSFPSSVIDGDGVDVERIGGTFKLNLAFDDFAPPVTGVSDPAHQNVLLWNDVTNAYVLASISLVGSGGAVQEAPADGVQYGRQSLAWTPIVIPVPILPSNTDPLMDGVATPGLAEPHSRGDHVHPTDTSRAPLASPVFTGDPQAPTPTIGDNDTSIATTAFVTTAMAGVINVSPSNTNPGMDGVAAPGVSALYSRGDHIHPADTTKQAADTDLTAVAALSGTGIARRTATTPTWTTGDPVTNAELATMPQFTLKGNNAVGSNTPTNIDIAALTTKASPGGGDYLLLSDQAASGVLKKLAISTLPGASGGISEAPNDGLQYSRQSLSWTVSGGGASPSNALPLIEGTANAGVSTLYARGDHVHPALGGAAAASISLTPTGGVAATDVQAAIAELDSEKVAKAGDVMTGGLTIQYANPQFAINKLASGQQAILVSRNNGLTRWTINLGSAATESGSGDGSNFAIQRFNDAGTAIDNPISIDRLLGNVTIANTVGIGVGATPTVGLRVLKPMTGSTLPIGIQAAGSVQSDATSAGIYFRTAATTQAATWTLPSLYHYSAAQSALGAGSTVSNQYGFAVDSSLIGAINNYGFYSAIPAGTNRWNFWGIGTARNYMNGALSIGATTDPGTGGLYVAGPTAHASTVLLAADPTLALQAATKQYVDRLIGLAVPLPPTLDLEGEDLARTCILTRTTTATYFDIDGVLKTAAANVPRMTYDPASRLPTGFLVESANTNLALRSQEFDNAAVWSLTAATVTPNVVVAPDGATTADKLIETATTNAHNVQQGMTVTSGLLYCFSCFVKAAERTWAMLVTNGGMPLTAMGVNLTTGAVTNAVAGTPLGMTSFNCGNGWYRVSFYAAATSTANAGFLVYLSQDGLWANRSYAGDGTSGIYVWGAQVEGSAAATYASSYIPTTTASVVRQPDTATIATDATWFNATEGTLIADINPSLHGNNGNTQAFQLDGGSSSNSIQVRFGAIIAGCDATVYSGGVNQADALGFSVVPFARQRHGFAYSVNDFSYTKDGATPQTDTSVTLPVGITRLNLTSATGGSFYWNRVTYYPKRLTDAQLQTLTTG